MFEREIPWYVIQVQPQRELEAASELVKQGFKILAPQLLKRTDHQVGATARAIRRQLMKPLVPRPLFPGYGFVSFDLKQPGCRWRSINGTRNVTKLLMAGEDLPLPVPMAQMTRIIDMIGPDGLIHEEAEDEPWKKMQGKQIQIACGPLVNQIGLCKESDEGRVKILLEILGVETKVTLPWQNVEMVG